jgi:DNA-binding HxlR family transcriptional regulator
MFKPTRKVRTTVTFPTVTVTISGGYTLPKSGHRKAGHEMGDRERFHRGLLDLIARPGVVEIIVALHERNGSASLSDLKAVGVPDLVPLLRSLAAAGQVSRADSGTWDAQPSPNTRFALTAAGTGLAHTLGEIEDWGRRNLRTVASRGRRPRGGSMRDN